MRAFKLNAAILLGMSTLLVGCAGSPKTDTPAPTADKSDSFERAMNRPLSANTLYSMAKILATQGRDRECEVVLKRVCREHPEFLAAYSSLAEVQLRGRRTDDAVASLSAGLKLSPNDPVLLNDIGMCYMVKRQYVQALQSFTAASAASPSDARYRANMAAALGLQGRYDEALALYLQIMPASEAHYNLGVLCQARDDADRAIQEFSGSTQYDHPR